MDEFARRLQEREDATQKTLQETMKTAEQLKKENATLRRVRNVGAHAAVLCYVMLLQLQEEREEEERIQSQHQQALERWKEQRTVSSSRRTATRRRNRIAPLPQKNMTQKRIHTAWQQAQEQVSM